MNVFDNFVGYYVGVFWYIDMSEYYDKFVFFYVIY